MRQGDWAVCTPGNADVENCVVQVAAQADGSCWGVQLQCDPHCPAILLGNGALLHNEIGRVGIGVVRGSAAFTELQVRKLE